MRASVPRPSVLLLASGAGLLSLLPSSAPGADARFVVDLSDRPEARVHPDELDDWLEAAAGRSPASAEHVSLLGRLHDGRLVPLEALLPPAAALPPEPPPGPPSAGVDNPGASTGALSGKTVYVSQCHGWIWYDSLGRFSTQRGNLYDTVEDFHNPEGADAYLVRYLENAGARVVTLRERDHNDQMVIVDNSDPGYSESGSGFEAGGVGFGAASSWAYAANPFATGSTRRFPDGGGATARFAVTPDTPGEYGLYISYEDDPGHSTTAHVRITHPGGVIDRTIDQTVHGGTWLYLETLWLPAEPDALVVEVVGDGTSGRPLSADAVRIGGGTGDVVRHGTTTGRPRWEEGAILYTQWNGAPTSVYDPYGDGDGSDPSARSRYAAWRHPAGEDAVYLSWHSNAGGGRGTSTYTYEGSSGPAASGSSALGQAVQGELVSAFRALWLSDWTDRGHRTAAFSEVSPYHNDEMPSALVELAFHDQEDDVWYLKQPEFRRDAARAMTRGIVQYFADRDGTAADHLPEPPAAVGAVNTDAGLAVSWLAGPAGDPFGDPASGWRIYTSADGRAWDSGTDASASPTVLDVPAGDTVFVRVTATNSGGESFPSEVVGARRMPEGVPPVLVVAAFDRLDGSLLVWEDVPVLGDLRRMTDQRRLNPYDGVAAHGRAISEAGWYFDAVSDDLLEGVDLDAYRAVVWIAGEESTTDESFSTRQQEVLTDYWGSGGTLWVSGSEVLWDLDYLGSESDRAFAETVLGSLMDDDDAGTESALGQDILDGLALPFDEASGAPYPVEYPDVLRSDRTVIAEYATGGTAAVLGEGVAHFGFPIESIGDEDTRTTVAAQVLDALVPDWEAPDLTEEPTDTADPTDDPDRDPDTPSGDTGDAGAAAAGGSGPGDAEDLSKLGGCGCSTAPPARWSWLLLGPLAWVGLRRRRPT